MCTAHSEQNLLRIVGVHGTIPTLQKQFCQISAFSRPSGGEGYFVLNYLVRFAEEYGFEYKLYGDGDIFVMDVAATPGCESQYMAMLQCHSDMVTVPQNMTTPRGIHRNGPWLETDGTTTLGADNGMGIAIALQYCTDPKAVHGPLRVLITPQEESGCQGIVRVPKAVFENVHYVINLDWESETICTGSGGIKMVEGLVNVDCHSRMIGQELKINISGVTGGHSGVEIHRDGASATHEMLRVLYELQKKCGSFGIVSIESGTGWSQIATSSEAKILFDSNCDQANILKHFDQIAAEICSEFRETDKNMKCSREFKHTEDPVYAAPFEWTDYFLSSAVTLQHGVWYRDAKGLPQTSSNMATLRTQQAGELKTFVFEFMLRGCVESQLSAMVHNIDASLFGCHGKTAVVHTVPGWRPEDSHLLRTAMEVFKKVFRRKVIAQPTHAGLECPTILLYNPNVEMISIGPRIENAHQVTERVYMPSCSKIYRCLSGILRNVA